MALIFVFAIGLCVGSFLNVLADRLPRGEDIFWGRSHCDYCKKTLRWYELVPVISFVLQHGKCLRCHKSLSWQYPLVELATAFGFLYIFLQYSGSPILLLSYYVLFTSLLVIFISDLKYQIIPDSMIVLGILATIVYAFSGGIAQREFLSHIISAIVACLAFYLLWAATRGRSMGFGDVKFSFLMGLCLGYPRIIIALYLAFLTGALVGVILIVTGKKRLKSHIAFGPFLVLGMIVAFVWGQHILAWWKGML